MNASACLYDAGVWVALAFASHLHHTVARAAFDKADSTHPAAFCRATQQSFMRVITTPIVQKVYGGRQITNEEAWRSSASPKLWISRSGGEVSPRSCNTIEPRYALHHRPLPGQPEGY